MPAVRDFTAWLLNFPWDPNKQKKIKWLFNTDLWLLACKGCILAFFSTLLWWTNIPRPVHSSAACQLNQLHYKSNIPYAKFCYLYLGYHRVLRSIRNYFLWVSFSKSWNCASCFGECNLNNSQVQINSKLKETNRMITSINNTNMKKFVWRKCHKIFLKAIFTHLRKTFFKVVTQNFHHHFKWYH